MMPRHSSSACERDLPVSSQASVSMPWPSVSSASTPQRGSRPPLPDASSIVRRQSSREKERLKASVATSSRWCASSRTSAW